MAVFERASGRWSAQVYDPAVRRAVSVAKFRADKKGTFDTEAKARRAVRDAEKEIARRSGRTAMTVGEWRDLWLTEGADRWKGKTPIHYRERTEEFAKQHGRLGLGDVTPAVAVRWAAEHKSTVPTLKTMFGRAVELELLERNPWRAVKTKKPRRQLTAGWLTAQDVDDLAAAALELFEVQDDDDGSRGIGAICSAMVLTAAWTMVRPSELFELRDHDVANDGDGPVLDVSRNVTSAGIGTTKKDDVRRIPLADRPLQAILAAREVRDGLSTSDLLFVNGRGAQWAGPSWHWRWSQIRAAIRRPDLDFYDLRHFGATWLLEQGVAVEDVAMMMGHRDGGKLVAEVYGHPDQRFARRRVRAAMQTAGRSRATA